jgi:hypothetical protein
MRQLLVLFMLTIVFGVLMAAGVAIADPGLSPDVPAHRHFVKQADGAMVEVGPRLCDNPTLQHAFNEFHANIHSHTLRDGTQIGAIGPVAPGLHNGSGPELIPGAC